MKRVNQDIPHAHNRVTPDEWARQLSAAPDYSSDPGRWGTALLRHWTGTAADMSQPELDHHYVVQHLGGAKHVERWRDGPATSVTVEAGSLTSVPAGTNFMWRTRGPIEFAHLYIPPEYLDNMASRLDRSKNWALIDTVGVRDPLLEALFTRMLSGVTRAASTLYLDSMLESFALQLLHDHSTATLRTERRRETLTRFHLSRVVEFVHTHFGEDLELADLARVAGSSVYHFSRAFKNATGETPYQFVIRRRVKCAQMLLTTTDLTVAQVAATCGFHSSALLTHAFRRLLRITPRQYRRERGGGGSVSCDCPAKVADLSRTDGGRGHTATETSCTLHFACKPH